MLKAAVLVVDDREHNRALLKSVLTGMDCEAICVASGEEALACARDRQFAVILLDVLMPDMNGLEVAASLRKQGNTSPVIFVTASDEERNKIKAYDTGCADYIVKPLEPKLIRAKVQVFLSLFLQNQQLEEMSSQLVQRNLYIAKVINNLSYNFRTHLNSISGFTQILKREEFADERLRSFVRNTEYSTQQLLMLMDNVVDAADLASGLTEQCPEPMEVASATKAVLEEAQRIAEIRQVSVEIQTTGSEIVLVDKTRFQQILRLMLHHVIESSRQSTAICVQIDAKHTEIVLSVTQPDYDKCTEASETPEIDEAGKDVNLSLCEGIVEAMKGSIQRKHTRDNSVCLVTHLPLHVPEQIAARIQNLSTV